MTKVFHLTTLSIFLITNISACVNGKQVVPCVFFFGDSLFDNGNNNFLITLAKVNYLPYGVDYPTGPTGRFSNGKNGPDFLAELLGFRKPIPPFASFKGTDNILKGVNYASGGAGILDETGREQGGIISMTNQLINHGITASETAILLGNATLAKERLSKCLYVVNLGSNDYLNNYFLPKIFLSSTLYTPQKIAAILINHYHRQLEILYNYGARKIVIFGLASLGSIPKYQTRDPSNGFLYVDSINKITQQFNSELKPLIDNLNDNLHGAQFILINVTSIAQGDPSTIGIRVTNAPCCKVSNITGVCEVGKEACSNRNEYYFWDNYHPTEKMNRVMITRAYDATLSSDVYPTDIRNLIRK